MRLLLAAAGLVPVGLLALAMAGQQVPVSTHDGAFHVEAVDVLRRGQPLPTWYPTGFHASAAVLLQAVPWVDSARGTIEIAEGLAALGPLATFGLGRSLGLSRLGAACAGLVLAVSYVYPYDDQMWGGWPMATAIPMVIGLWTVALHWIRRADARWAILGGALIAGIVLSHGVELYSGLVGLVVIAVLAWRRLRPLRLARHLALAAVLALGLVAPYLGNLLPWVGHGGASAAGTELLETLAGPAGRPDASGWLTFGLSLVGAATVLDVPVRAALLAIGLRHPRLRLVGAWWAVFGGLAFASTYLLHDTPAIQWLYTATFPWLVEHRLPQLLAIFASLLVGGGVVGMVGWMRRLWPGLVERPAFRRRLLVGCGLAAGFLVEGNAVTIYKTLAQVVGEANVYTADDARAMGWLRQHAAPGDMLINDGTADAGIWAPYKADVPIVLPRSGAGAAGTEARAALLEHVLELHSRPSAEASACALHAEFVYDGARQSPYDARALPPRAQLEQAADLQEVFRSGQAVVFRLRLPCST